MDQQDKGKLEEASKATCGDIVDQVRSSIDTETMNPRAALLAEDETAYMDNIHEIEEHSLNQEIAQWIGSILGENLHPETIGDELSSGVRLLHLAKSIQLIKSANTKDAEYNEVVRDLQPDDVELSKYQPHKRASLVARQRSNIAKFLDWCKYMGVPSIMLFESEDIVNVKNLRQVATCILYVARIASEFGIEPPSSVKEEMEREARLLTRKSEDIVKTPLVNKKQLIQITPPIFEHDEEYADTPTSTRHNYIADFDGRYGRTSTPSSVNNSFRMHEMKPFEPLEPVELQFEEQELDAVIVETLNDTVKTKVHFDPKPYIEDVEITETPDMIIIDKVDDGELKDVSRIHGITRFEDGMEVRVSPLPPDVNGNCDVTTSTSRSSDDNSTTENEYYTARGTFSNNDVTNLMYHTAYVDDVSDDEVEYIHDAAPAFDGEMKISGATVTSSNDFPGYDDVKMTSPYRLRRIPADSVTETDDRSESSEESSAEVESYVSDDDANDVTYTDVGVGTDDLIKDDLKPVKEIMINFPPYFEISKTPRSNPITRREYIVAPVRKEPIYTMPEKPDPRERTTRSNLAYETETRSTQSFDDFSTSTDTNHPRRYYAAAARSDQPPPLPDQASNKAHVDKSTQTHVSLSNDIVRIINEMGDIPKIRTATSSVSSHPTTPTSGNGSSTMVTAQYQKTLPTYDRNIAVIQATDLESGRPARYGSVTGSSRYKMRDVEAAGAKTVRRSMLSRASSAISEQFEKAVVVAKKYKKEISIVLIFLILTAAALIAMAIVFPQT